MKKGALVSYEMVSPGYEGVYTGERISPPNESTDKNGNVIDKWCVWTWNGEESKWGPEIKYINKIQVALEPLDDSIRAIRSHMASFVSCERRFPVTVDELLNAIGIGKLPKTVFHNGCWWPNMLDRPPRPAPQGMSWEETVYRLMSGYLAGEVQRSMVEALPHAEDFVSRVYGWLGDRKKLTGIQELMIERLLLPMEFFTGRAPDYDMAMKRCFQEGGRGVEIDHEISELAELPPICRHYSGTYRKNLAQIDDPVKTELYTICCHMSEGICDLSNCHHASLRRVERWLHAIGTNQWEMKTRKAGAERKRLAQFRFGYCLAMDKWLLGKSADFILLQIAHGQLCIDPTNEIIRTYAYLGEKNPKKEWLVACLWFNLTQALMNQHQDLIGQASSGEFDVREWMDSQLTST